MDLRSTGSGGSGQVRGYITYPEPITSHATHAFGLHRFGSSAHRAGACAYEILKQSNSNFFLACKTTNTPRTPEPISLKALSDKAFNRFGVVFSVPNLPRTTRTSVHTAQEARS